MRRPIISIFLVIVLWGTAISLEADQYNFFEQANDFFQTYVHHGLVDYQSLKANKHDLNGLVSALGQIDLARIDSRDYEKAVWINAYNILVIYGVVQSYPVKSPQDIAGFFDGKKYEVAGEKLTLDTIEKQKLLKQFDDPRIHFVLVCAALGCPSIINNAYFPSTLDSQLTVRTGEVLNKRQHVRISHSEKKVYLSKIFKWYQDDFTTKANTVMEYINQYRTNAIPSGYEVTFIPYDWTLNDFRYRKSEINPPGLDNIRVYTPSTLLSRGQWEFKHFSNLYTQTAYFNNTGEKISTDNRSTYYTSINSLSYGFRQYLNIGFDFYLKSVRNSPGSSSPFEVFRFDSGVNSKTAFTYFAPKIKFSPIKKLPGLSCETAFIVPLTDDPEGKMSGKPFLEYEDYQWWNRVFYDLSLGVDYLLYLESDFFLRFDPEGANLFSPFKALMNYYPSDKWTGYISLEFSPTWGDDLWSAYYFQTGAGLKFLPISHLELESLITIFPLGENSGAGMTYNVGIRIIH